GELLAVVTLRTLDGERKGPPKLGQEGEARAMMQPPIEPQDTEARAVVQRSVLKRPAARDLHVLHVDLNRLSRVRLLEEFHLAGFPLAGAPQAGQAQVAKPPLDRVPGPRTPIYVWEPGPGT